MARTMNKSYVVVKREKNFDSRSLLPKIYPTKAGATEAIRRSKAADKKVYKKHDRRTNWDWTYTIKTITY